MAIALSCIEHYRPGGFFEGLHAGHYPLRCGVCKRYFLQTTAHPCVSKAYAT
ncbi:MAG: DUF6076 domain-containing protein [Oscillospiraceae bacterium]|nr:DUF6076 domain-containing protein [Oscillospiraceae bacterium]